MAEFYNLKGVVKEMEIKKAATAGTLESSDVYVEIEPASGLKLHIESVVQQQFGQEIDRVVREVLKENGVENAAVSLNDKGAVECVIRARVETALRRGEGAMAK
ncbi:citrate lyase acyl carrier protein [Acidaminobacterium chupaoyuni]